MADRTIPLGEGERAWLDRLIAPLARGRTILALHPGGGEPIARYLIDCGFHIVGIEPSETLIALARTRFPRERWLFGDMRQVELNETFDGVLAWDCLSYLPRADQDVLAKRAAAWLKPGGRLLCNAVAAEEPVEGFRAGSRYGNALEPADYSGALARAGLIEVAHVAHDPGCSGAGIWLGRKPETAPPDQISPASGLDGSA